MLHLKVKVLLPGPVMLHARGMLNAVLPVVIVAVTVMLPEPAGMTETG